MSVDESSMSVFSVAAIGSVSGKHTGRVGLGCECPATKKSYTSCSPLGMGDPHGVASTGLST